MTRSPPQNLTIGIGSYNDQSTIGEILDEAASVTEELAIPVSVLVIDDGSRDDTVNILERFQSSMPTLRVVEHGKNQGYAATLKELYATADDDALFTCPGDGQVSPRSAIELWPLLADADVVIGRRSPRRDSTWRRLQSRYYVRQLRRWFGLSIKDPNSSKLWRRHAYQALDLKSESPFIEVESILAAQDRGWRVVEHPILHRPRREGKGSGGRWSTIRATWREAIKTRDERESNTDRFAS